MVRGGCLIKLAREARGMTQEDIANGWGVDVKSIQRWESYQNEPRFFDVYGIITEICKLSLAEVEEMTVENR